MIECIFAKWVQRVCHAFVYARNRFRIVLEISDIGEVFDTDHDIDG